MFSTSITLISSILVFCLWSMQAAADREGLDCATFQKANYIDAQNYLHGLLGVYYTCDRNMIRHPLAGEELRLCRNAYMLLKLNFISGVSHADYVGLSSAERSAVNKIGYKRFKAWEKANLATVTCLKQVSVQYK